ncbi:hypothetical protein [Streptomyces zagrosensis]|uniref:Lipoprotein n=1 Tax=Streptomyces zagrosensis TaxID=1042984 RepID=A0A7W9QFZ2_9ACTN|nr:hypothetical protein [Streptomyces zagrosensis]MBB5939565.1 hypothetical protein [Streptomyces zagrosensis]
MRNSVSRALVAVSVAGVLGLTAACSSDSGSDSGGDGDKKPSQGGSSAGERPGAGGEPGADGGASLSQPQLKKAALVKGDVTGFEFQQMTDKEAAEGGAPKAADKECQPLAAMLGSSPVPKPSAAVYGTFTEGGDDLSQVGLIGMVRLSSYSGDDATAFVEELRGAVTACAKGFSMTTGDGSKQVFSEVKPVDAAKLGDEVLAYRVVDAEAGAPSLYTVVRSGPNVSVFFAGNMVDPKKVEMPAAVVKAQVAKIENAAKAAKG